MNPVHPLSGVEWDALAENHPAATPFHSSAWARVLLETYAFQPFYLVEHRHGEIVGGLPLMEVRGLTGRRRGVSLPFSDSCLPLTPRSTGGPPAMPACAPPPSGGAGSLDRQADQSPLLRAAINLGRDRGWRSLEMREATAWMAGSAPSVQFYGHAIPLAGGEEAVVERFSSAARRALRKADAAGLLVTQGNDQAAMRTYYQLHGLTRRRHGLPPQPWGFFERLQRHVLGPGRGFVILARVGDRPVAGAVFLIHGASALYKFGASDEHFHGLRPNNRVFLEAIRVCIARGCAMLDLGRTSLGNEGLRRFKTGLGAMERAVPYLRYDLRTGCTVETPDRASGWHATVFRFLPAPAAAWLGERLYRFAA